MLALTDVGGLTTSIHPSVGNHVAPCGIHFMIHLPLVAALLIGVASPRRAKLAQRM